MTDVSRLSLLQIADIVENGVSGDCAEACAARIRALDAFWRRPKHERDDKGVCVAWCYACERAGLQARIKFTEDYETLRYQLAEAK